MYPFPVAVHAVAASVAGGGGGGGALTPETMDGATWVGRGDDYTDSSLNNPGTGNNIKRWNNRVSGSSLVFEAASTSFAPTMVRLTPEISGCHMGIGASLDDFDNGSTMDNYITGSEWHCFAVVNFDTITANGGLLGHYIFGACTGGGQPSAYSTAPWGVFIKLIGSQNYAVGYMYNGTTVYSVSASITEDEYTLIEFYGSGGTMGIRSNQSASVEDTYTGTISSLSSKEPKAGSKNFNGSWEIGTNRIFELSFANQKNADVTSVRDYFATRYGMPVT